MAKNSEKKLIILGGATGSGKTALAIRLAQHFETEIVSADSRQFFREMNIGTAKPTAAERAAAPHHLVDNLSIEQTYSVGDFERDALFTLNQIFETHDVAICVGGTGLYLRALCEGLDDLPDVDPAIKIEIQQKLAEEGLESLQNWLKLVDFDYFSSADMQNPSRVMRALGVWVTTQKPFSSFRTGEKKQRPFQIIYLKTEWERAILYDRINRRVDLMLENGLLNEVQNLLPFRHLNALQTVGYQEFFDYFDEKIDYKTAVERIKQHSRNYAKRQETWFRKPISTTQHYVGFHPENWTEILAYVNENLNF